MATREFTRTLRVQRRTDPQKSRTPARRGAATSDLDRATSKLVERGAPPGTQLASLWRAANPAQRLLLISIGIGIAVLSAILAAKGPVLWGL